MTVHLFGAVSSPSSANYALRKICDDNESEYDSEVTDTIKRNFYVDDCLRSVKTKATAIELVNDIRQACAQGGFNLTKFICNDRDVLESIPLEHRSKEVKSLDLECDDLPIERALGVQWCVETDIFQFKFRITVSNKPLTRRGILSTVSSIYDPLGILSPFTLVAKKLLQELCCEKAVGWDAEIPEHYLVRWDKWQRELPLLEQLILNRCLTPSEFGEIISQQVHVFSDASSTGYGAVAYLRQCDNENRTHCAFLMGKARLAPIKTMTIPRLELTAATVSTRMGHLLKSELDENPSFTYHTDSTTVLRYIANQQTRFKVFVSNRVQTIRDLTDVGQWRYVDTKENPADDASRGLGAQSLLDNKRWLNGPKFLLLTEHEWPEQPFSMGEVEKDDPEVKGATCAASSHATLVDHSAASVDKLIRHYSDWYRLKKAVAVFLRVRKILRERAQKRIKVATNASEETKLQTATDDQSSQLTVQDLQEAELAIVQYVQSQAYGREIRVLDRINEVEELHDRTKRKMIKTEIKKTSSIYCLDPYLDQGTLRVGGRLSRANLPPHSVHPIILPRENHVTALIIKEAHKILGHTGRGHVLSRLRERYWIISANAAVRHVLSKAVHIEIANSLETDSFIQALRRFIARRGPVRTIRSDNGTNFVGAQAELRQAIKEMDHGQIRDKLRKQEIDWIFNPPAASHMGGVWERQIQTTRKVLAGLLQEHGNRLDDESLRTLMCEVEAVINSRPLTFISNDIDDLEPLTPSHLLTTKSAVIVPPPGNFQKGPGFQTLSGTPIPKHGSIHFTGYLKSWPPSDLPLEDEDEDQDSTNLSCLIAVGREVSVADVNTKFNDQTFPTEFVSRHGIDGKFTYADQRVSSICGYLPQELVGMSAYDYIHPEDLDKIADSHKDVLINDNSITRSYRFLCKAGHYIYFKSKSTIFRNPWSKEVEFIIAINAV
ncbi:hypothetical protein QZH41_007445, partial [Actinostola sp. cb2023]